MSRYVAWTALRFVPLAVAGLVFVTACSDGCTDTLVSQNVAPDGGHRAVLLTRDCGATTGFSTQISVLKAGEVLAGRGNVFIADDDHGGAHAAAWGGPWAMLRWAAPDTLHVRFDGKARIFVARHAVAGVKIRYEKTAHHGA